MPSNIKTFLILFVFSFALWGCKDTSDYSSAKKTRAAVESAMKEFASKGDFEAAQKTLRKNLEGESGSSAVSLLQGGLKFGRAEQMAREIEPNRTSINKNLEELSGIAGQIMQVRLEKEQIETALRSRQDERSRLISSLDGDANSTGLNLKIKDIQTESASLKSRQSEILAQLNEKLSQAAEIQRQSDELRAKAELLRGQEKADLQKQAYEILIGTQEKEGKNAFLADAQKLKDQLDGVESEIALLEPKAALLTDQITKIQSRINELDNSDFAAKSNDRLTAISASNSSFQEEFSGVLGQLKQTQDTITNEMKQISDLLSSAQKDFKKMSGDESLRDFSRTAEAEVTASEARILSEHAFWQKQLAARLTILSSMGVTESEPELRTLAKQYSDESDDYAAKALVDYNDASNLYGKIPARKDDFAVSVLKRRIFVLAQRAYLAQRTENNDIKYDSIRQAKELIEKAVKLDPSFEQSAAMAPYDIAAGDKASSETPNPQANTTAEPNKTDAAKADINKEDSTLQEEPNAQDANIAEPNL